MAVQSDMLTMTDSERRFAARTARLVQVVKDARKLTHALRRLDRGLYEIEPAAVLSLRSSVAAAELCLIQDGRSSDAC